MKVLRVSSGPVARRPPHYDFSCFFFSLPVSLLAFYVRFFPPKRTLLPRAPLPSVSRLPGMKIKFKNGSVVKQSPKAKKIKRLQGI